MTTSNREAPSGAVLIVEDDDAYRRFLVGELTDIGFAAHAASDARAALAALEEGDYSAVLLDIKLPGMDGLEALRRIMEAGPDAAPQVIMMTGHGSIDTAIEAMKLGAYDYLTKPCDIKEMRAVLERACERRALRRENEALRAILKRREGDVEIVGRGVAVREVISRVGRIAPTDASVLILGESGTGKELAAQLIHQKSRRADKPFVDVNCGAMPETLFESEFFGHERGAFTGASARKTGLVEAADGGTLFLDEVSEMPVQAQVKLLRFLETGRFRRLGAVRSQSADVRVLAASNRPLDTFVDSGTFRRDLFFRLAVVTLEVPALRARREDIPVLALHFIRVFSAVAGTRVIGIDDEALAALAAYDWPGNIRELRNAIESAVILCDAGRVRLTDLPERVARPASGLATSGHLDGEGLIETLDDLERRHIAKVLERCGGHRERTARALGIGVKTLYRKLRDYRISPPGEAK